MTDAARKPDETNAPPPRDLRAILLGAVVLAVFFAILGVLVAMHLKPRRERNLGPAWKYDDTPAASVQPPLYRRVAVFTPAGIERLRGLAVKADRVCLLGAGEARLYALATVKAGRGEASRTVALPQTPTCAAFGDERTLYVGLGDRVARVDLDEETPPIQWNSYGPRAQVTSVAVAPDGARVCVADAGNRVIHAHDTQGKLLQRYAEKNTATGAPGLVVPSPHLDVLAADLLWVVNPGRHQVEGYNREGDLMARWGRFGTGDDAFTGCCNPSDIARLGDGRFLASEKGAPRIKLFSAAGAFAGYVAPLSDFGRAPGKLDLAATEEGAVLVTVPRDRAVWLYEPLTKE